MLYKDKLKKPKWQKKRLEILDRDNFTCTSCKSSENELQVHHLDYLPGIDPWEYPNDMLITLCIYCHNKETKRELLESNLATTLKMKGFLSTDLVALSCLIDTNKKFTNSLLKSLRNGNF